MKILLTGCAGFIGSHLLHDLLSHGHEVVGVDNMSTGFEANISMALGGLECEPKFQLYKTDIADRTKLADVFAEHQFGAVCHQAALGSVPRSIHDPLATFDANILGTMNLLNLCRLNAVKRFVFASSSSVYGDNPDPSKIEGREGQTLSPYAESKATCERLAFNFGRVYGLETIALRYFNVFGPRQNPDGTYAAVIPKWISAMKKGETITINGTGETSRDFCFVANVVKANLLALDTKDPDVFNQPFNVACDDSYSLNSLLYLLVELIQPESYHAVHTKERAGDVKNSRADLTKSGRLLGYSPKAFLIEGLRKTIKYY